MTPIKGYPQSPPPGLNEAVEAAGIVLVNESGVWKASDPVAAEKIAATYDPTDHVRAEKSAQLADERWQRETGGFMFQPSGADRPYLFKSTREAMGPVMGAVLAVQSGVFPDPTMWKTAEPGAVFVPLTAADVLPLFKAFAAHVAASFAEEAQKQDTVKSVPWQDAVAVAIEAAPADKP